MEFVHRPARSPKHLMARIILYYATRPYVPVVNLRIGDWLSIGSSQTDTIAPPLAVIFSDQIISISDEGTISLKVIFRAMFELASLKLAKTQRIDELCYYDIATVNSVPREASCNSYE
jgi:hypothetical protein